MHSSNRWTKWVGSYPQRSKVHTGTQLQVTISNCKCKYKLIQLPYYMLSRQNSNHLQVASYRSPAIIVASAIAQLPNTQVTVQVAKHKHRSPKLGRQTQVASNYQLQIHNCKYKSPLHICLWFSNCKLPTQQLHITHTLHITLVPCGVA